MKEYLLGASISNLIPLAELNVHAFPLEDYYFRGEIKTAVQSTTMSVYKRRQQNNLC